MGLFLNTQNFCPRKLKTELNPVAPIKATKYGFGTTMIFLKSKIRYKRVELSSTFNIREIPYKAMNFKNLL